MHPERIVCKVLLRRLSVALTWGFTPMLRRSQRLADRWRDRPTGPSTFIRTYSRALRPGARPNQRDADRFAEGAIGTSACRPEATGPNEGVTMPELQRALDNEWETFRVSAAGARALAGWSAEDPRYRAFQNLGELRGLFEQRDHTERRDALLADLLRRCPDDLPAQRVLLAALRPGLVKLAKRAAAFWEREEAESIVIAAALDRLANRTITFPPHAAAGVLGSVWSSVWERRRRERWEEEYWGQRAGGDALDLVETQHHGAPADRLLAFVGEAVRSGAVPARGARLVILHWIHGYSNNELAELDGLRPCTIRKHRRDAEQRLAEFVA